MIFELNLANLFLIGAAWLVNRLFPGPNSRADTPADPGTEQRSRATSQGVINPLYGQWEPFEALIDIRPDTADLLTTPNVNTNSASQQRFNATDNIFSLVEASANKNIVLV